MREPDRTMTSPRFMAPVAMALLTSGMGPLGALAQVLPEPNACRPTTSARSRDGNCVSCTTGPTSTRPSFIDLVEKVRARRGIFDDIDRRIDAASTNPEAVNLLK